MKKTITALMLLCVVCFGQQAGSFKDPRDGKTYKTVKIGKQTWMAENLNYNASSSKCYDDKSANCNKYGRLYHWNDLKNVCPKGWHLPSNLEWNSLYQHIGDNAENKLKAKNGWDDYDPCEGIDGECDEAMKSGNGEDKYGFAALPGGFGCSWAGVSSVGSGSGGFWWCASESNSDNVCFRSMGHFIDMDGDFGRDTRYKSTRLSVRCVKDE